MARANLNIGIPYDEPVLIRPGVEHREADRHSSAHWFALPPEHPERARKGDLGEKTIKGMPSRHSFENPATPFVALKKWR